MDYILENAVAQCGTEPPYRLLPIPHRMKGKTPQLKLNGRWVTCHKDKPRPRLDSYFGLPVAGISTSWRPAN